jgi:predicted ABC-type exoprotein transport system permease subunit
MQVAIKKVYQDSRQGTVQFFPTTCILWAVTIEQLPSLQIVSLEARRASRSYSIVSKLYPMIKKVSHDSRQRMVFLGFFAKIPTQTKQNRFGLNRFSVRFESVLGSVRVILIKNIIFRFGWFFGLKPDRTRPWTPLISIHNII